MAWHRASQVSIIAKALASRGGMYALLHTEYNSTTKQRNNPLSSGKKALICVPAEKFRVCSAVSLYTRLPHHAQKT